MAEFEELIEQLSEEGRARALIKAKELGLVTEAPEIKVPERKKITKDELLQLETAIYSDEWITPSVMQFKAEEGKESEFEEKLERLGEAIQLNIEEGMIAFSVEESDAAIDICERAQDYENAGRICYAMGDGKRAVEFNLRLGRFRSAATAARMAGDFEKAMVYSEKGGDFMQAEKYARQTHHPNESLYAQLAEMLKPPQTERKRAVLVSGPNAS